TTSHLSAMSDPPGFAPRSAGGGVLLETHVLDLVEEGAVADLQHLGGLHAVPAALLERTTDHLALGFQHGPARDFLEGEAFGRGERLRHRRHGRRRRDW